MDRQESEIIELTADELGEVSGGLKNNQTEAWAFVQIGMAMAKMEGGSSECLVK
jgi:hypothetical protein